MEISKLGKGRCILIDDHPYRIMETKTVVISKHSHTRTKVILEDVFTGEKLTKNMAPHEQVRELDILRKKGQLVAKINDKVQVMDLVSYETFDADIDKALLESLVEGDEITFLQFGGYSKVVDKRS